MFSNICVSDCVHVCVNLAVCHISAFDLYPQLTEPVDMSSAGIRVDMVYKYVCSALCTLKPIKPIKPKKPKNLKKIQKPRFFPALT